MMLPTQYNDWKEYRRFLAYEMYQQGWYQTDIAKALGVAKSGVSQWISRAKKEGVESLRTHKAPGPTPRLSAEQMQQLPLLLAKGAEAYGFSGDVWTRKRVAAVIEQEWHVKYHPDHIGRLLAACGWTRQKPTLRATQRDEQAIRDWCEQRFPTLKKSP